MSRRLLLFIAIFAVVIFAWFGYVRWRHHHKLIHHPLDLLMEADKDDAVAEFYAIKASMSDSAFRAFQSMALADPQNDFQVLLLLCRHASEYPWEAPSLAEFEQKAALLNSFPSDTVWFTTVDGEHVRIHNGTKNASALIELNRLVGAKH